MRNFMELLKDNWDHRKFVCVGLDSDLGKIPETVMSFYEKDGRVLGNAIIGFNRAIVNATKDCVCAYKPNIAFYVAHGSEGLAALHNTILYIHEIAPDVPVILDAKVADIGNTNNGYVQMAFDYLQADAITVHPYLGQEALQPFLDRADKGIIVLCRTSNPGAGEFQDIPLMLTGQNLESFERNRSREMVPLEYLNLYKYIAYKVATRWNKNENCALVVGATYPNELRDIREIVGDMPILIPGIGAQGGDVEKTVTAGKDSKGQGMIINSSRGIIFASKEEDFAEAARRETLKLHELINQYR